MNNLPNQPIISVKQLVKKFNNFTAVDHISFKVQKGEIFAFLGPNGAGKSTTIKMLTTLLKPSGGELYVNGFNPLKNQDDVRKSFGIVFQDSSLDFELTAYENMDFHGILYKIPFNLRKKRIKELLNIIELWNRKNDLVKTFSGGMRRRLEIARGLLHHPRIFFLDEPTLGLDPQTRNQIWNYIGSLNKKEGITIFFTTHYMEEAEKMAERIAIIDNGKIVSIGTASELKNKTNTNSLEAAFLALTGNIIREEKVSSLENLRIRRQMFKERR
ncbi:MAG: hypothetical protein ACD_12C00692G0003 [uncultured bacterium]|nr:MAG: hypothetical protein ACD_12C00692G0003 [uncultured bacterium]